MQRMRCFLSCSLSTLTAATVFVAQPLVGAEVAPVLLRYVFAPGQTNAYSLQIESQGEAGREAIAGTFVVSARPVGSNFIRLTFRGQLRPSFQPVQPGMMPMPPYRPGGPMSLSAYTMGLPTPERELIIDEHGQIVRLAGDQVLPIPLGQLTASLVQAFPVEATAGWEQDKDVSVLDEPLLQGPASAFLNPRDGYYFGGFMPGRGAQGVLTARQKTKVKITAITPQTVTLQKTFSLDTLMLTGAEPRVSASGEGQIEFDRALGIPKRVELECKTVAATENLSRRSVLSLHWRLLEGEEREKALAPPLAIPEKKLGSEEVAGLQQQMKSGNTPQRMIAARELSSARLTNPPPELIAEMVSLANDPEETVRRAALTIVANHGGKEQVPLLIKSLSDSDAGVRNAVAKGLGRIKDPRAIEPLATLLATGQSDQPYFRSNRDSAVAEALVHIGPAAEPAVLALLKEKNVETRIQACNVLRQVGSKKSLGPLKDLTTNPSKELSEAAAEACRAIQSRETH
jgi:hypothetical protein